MKGKTKTHAASDLYRLLPSVDEVLRLDGVAAHATAAGHAAVAEAARAVLAKMRQEIAAGRLDAAALELAVGGLAAAVERELRRSLEPSLRPVINATGVVLHTNLGRAPLAAAAIEHIARTAAAFCNLEYDVAAGERGKRDVHVQRLLAQRFARDVPNEVASIVVNNNAAAVLVALNTLAGPGSSGSAASGSGAPGSGSAAPSSEGGEVIVSRGELVEIGGSFRIPEVMAKSGAVLREVGTTNRTRLADYERAINERTRLLLRVHRSNFQIVGFTEQPALAELVALGRKRGIAVMEDLGSGALIEPESLGIGGEPGVAASLSAGVDVVSYSGDKLLGGPQAGILSGRPEVIARIRQNPLFRALRVDKLVCAALEATLLAYVRQEHDSIPALRMLRLTAGEIGLRAQALAGDLRRTAPALHVEVIEGESVTGGGAAPAAKLPTQLLAVTAEHLSADELAARLRANDLPIITRVDEGRVLLDLRTVFPEQEAALSEALRSAAVP